MGRYRAIMTDTDREYIADGEDIDEHKRYQAVSRVRSRIQDELKIDVEILQEHHEDLLKELREVVCEDVEKVGIAESESSEEFIEPVVESEKTDVKGKEMIYEELQTATEPGSPEEVLRDLDLPGSGSNFEARVNAVLKFYEHLRDHANERVTKGDLEGLVEEHEIDVGYSSFDSLWNNWVKSNASQGREFNTLEQLPGVVMDGDDYIYTGEDDG